MTLRRVTPASAWWLHDSAGSRAAEQAGLASLPPHTLMQRAGTSVARLALAIAPHARLVRVMAGPGNNGGDGYVAAAWLHRAGRRVDVVAWGDPARLQGDAAWAHAQARAAGVEVRTPQVEMDGTAPDLVIDALLGLGTTRAITGPLADAVAVMNGSGAPVLAVDLPSGLAADTGAAPGPVVQATHTLALLTLKPGLFTAAGRDACGALWFDDLDAPAAPDTACARLSGPPAASTRRHGSHKGSYGDTAVVGGAPGMTGAAWLAARAALAAGAGRVYASPLDHTAPMLAPAWPELMGRHAIWLEPPARLRELTVVCGCGGGAVVRGALPPLLAHAPRLVLDADALNAIAADQGLRQALCSRGARGLATVLTPHPLEAARLLGSDTGSVQADRLRAATALARELGCVVLLKGSGSVIAAPQTRPVLNPSGNALLAGGGTGDVLAGWVGGLWAQLAAARSEPPAAGVDSSAHAAHGSHTAWQAAWQAARAATWLHGHAADRQLATAECTPGLRAGDLVERMRELAAVRRASPPARQP